MTGLRRLAAVVHLVPRPTGAVFGLQTGRIRLQPWMGPAYGFPVWLGCDHLRFGLVVAVMRARPRE